MNEMIPSDGASSSVVAAADVIGQESASSTAAAAGNGDNNPLMSYFDDNGSEEGDAESADSDLKCPAPTPLQQRNYCNDEQNSLSDDDVATLPKSDESGTEEPSNNNNNNAGLLKIADENDNQSSDDGNAHNSSISPPTLPSSTPATSNNKHNGNEDPATLSPGTQTLIAEAERQAAIVAAISANMSSLYNSSPSVAGSIAKVMSQSASHQNRSVGSAPSPPVALMMGNNNKSLLYQQQLQPQPTMVALPPLPPSPPLVGISAHHHKQQQPPLMMKPVRFYDVRVAFDAMDKKTKMMGSTNDDNKSDEEDEKKNNVDAVMTEEETTKETENSSSSTTTTTSTLPDSFLRFLLLLAHVPIIIEEGEKLPPPSNQQLQQPVVGNNNTQSQQRLPDDNAVTDAAQRIHELYTLIQNTYDSIHKRQLQSPSLRDDGGMTTGSGSKREYKDATASFFAACSGEIVKFAATAANDHVTTEGRRQQQQRDGKSGAVVGAVNIGNNVGRRPSLSIPTTATSSSAAHAAVASASVVFSNVMSKVTKKQSSFSDIGKKFMRQDSHGGGGDRSNNSADKKVMSSDNNNYDINNIQDDEMTHMRDYEVTIDQEMLGLTVENVLERTIIRTLLSNGAAIHAGAKIGSLIAKVGNVDTSNLTHFETIDELRQSQRPLKLTLRYISSDILRCAREEMGRLIRGRNVPSSSSWEEVVKEGGGEAVGEGGSHNQTRQLLNESFDSVLRDRWPSSSNSSSSSRGGGISSSMMMLSSSSAAAAAPAVMTRAEMIHHAGNDLIRILALLVVGMEKELLASIENVDDDNSHDASQQLYQPFATMKQHLSPKELNEAIEITSKILLEYARGHPEIDGKRGGSVGRQHGSSFYPVPPGRVQGKKQKGKAGKGGKKTSEESPLLRIGDALQRTRFFLVETSSITATALRWEIIDYLCTVLDLDTEQELSEKEAASATDGGEASPTNDLGSAGSILKLIVLNCSTSEDDVHSLGDDSSLSLDDQSTRSGSTSHAGNSFISVVHRLAASKSTSARIAACSLGPVLWSHLDFPRQLQLRGVITRALHDVEVIVRKSTATVLHEIAELVFDRRSVPWLVLMCERSMTDPEPQLRAAAMTLTWHLAEHLPNAFLGDANKGSLSIRRLPPRTDPTFMDVYLLQCKLLPVASNLAEDRVASVRLSVAAQCDRLVNAMGEHWFNIIIDLLQALLSDSDERVRSEATLCIPRFAESVILGTEEHQDSTVVESLMPLALKLQKDPSPLVRSSLATAAGELLIFLVGLGGGGTSYDAPSSPLRRESSGGAAPPSPRSPRREYASAEEAVGHKRYKKHVDETFIPILQRLLQDPDPEVTTASLRAVTNASRSSRHESSTSVPSCSHNKFDPGDDDLVSVASMTSLQSHLSVDRTKPVFIPVLSENQVLRLLPTLSNLATSAQWRVRQSAVEIVPALLGCTHRHETRHEISKLCLTLMCDKVDAVRKTAAECLCLGGSNLARHGEDDGGEWISKIVIPHLISCSRSEDSKQRMLSLKMIEVIITNGLCPARLGLEGGIVSPTSSHSDESELVVTKESAVRTILAVAASLSTDTVPNVRLNVGRVLVATISLLDRSDAEFAASLLEKQINDEKNRDSGCDRDVLYFAQQAITISRQHSSLSELRRESSLMD